MFKFFSKNDEVRSLNEKLGRFLNSIQYSDLETERNRTESRTRIALPCIMFVSDEASSPKRYAVGISSDISLHGMALFTPEALPAGEYIVMIDSGKSQLFVEATLRRCDLGQYGFHAVGFEFLKLLREKDFPAIVEAIESLNTPQNA